MVPFQLRLQSRKSLNHAHHVLVRTDSAGIKQKRIVHLIALRDEFAIGLGSMSMKEALVDGVVDDLDALRRNLKQLLHLILREVRDREDPSRPA